MSPKSHRPIGYWIKQADAALTQAIDTAQASNGVTRFEWQTLNLIFEEGRVADDEIATALAPFADASRVRDTLSALSERQWIVADSASRGVTEAGRAAHARILAAQQQIRQQAMTGIAGADYETTLHVLQRLAANLGYPGTGT